jgi:hypothetical protein
MCRFICNSGRIRADQVCLEVEEIEGRLSANLQAPDCTPELVRFECVPLLTAVEMARLMADALRTDVVVVDRLGVWRDWLAAPTNMFEGSLARVH